MLLVTESESNTAMVLFLIVGLGMLAAVVVGIVFEIRRRFRRQEYIQGIEQEIERIRFRLQQNEKLTYSMQLSSNPLAMQKQQLLLQKISIEQTSLSSRLSQLQHELTEAKNEGQSSTFFFIWWGGD